MKVKKPKRMLACVLVLASLAVVSASAAFSDVPADYWAASYIERAAADGAVAGSNGRYDPNGTLTYAECLTVLMRSFYADRIAANSDATDRWFRPYTRTAWDTLHISVAESLLEQPCTRYTLAQYMSLILRDKQVALPDEEARAEAASRIADWSRIPGGYQDDVALVYSLGLLTGVDAQGTFDGAKTLTRAQMAVIYCKLRDTVGASAVAAAPVVPDTYAPGTWQSRLYNELMPIDYSAEIKHPNTNRFSAVCDRYVAMGYNEREVENVAYDVRVEQGRRKEPPASPEENYNKAFSVIETCHNAALALGWETSGINITDVEDIESRECSITWSTAYYKNGYTVVMRHSYGYAGREMEPDTTSALWYLYDPQSQQIDNWETNDEEWRAYFGVSSRKYFGAMLRSMQKHVP